MTQVWKIRALNMYKELIGAYKEVNLFRNDFILRADAKNVLISNTSKSTIISIKKSIDYFLTELERFEESIRNNSEVSVILDYVCSAKNRITNDLHSQVKYFLSIFDAGSPQSGDLVLIIQTFQDFFDCYTTAIEKLLTL